MDDVQCNISELFLHVHFFYNFYGFKWNNPMNSSSALPSILSYYHSIYGQKFYVWTKIGQKID